MWKADLWSSRFPHLSTLPYKEKKDFACVIKLRALRSRDYLGKPQM